jgi:hypothetical protein
MLNVIDNAFLNSEYVNCIPSKYDKHFSVFFSNFNAISFNFFMAFFSSNSLCSKLTYIFINIYISIYAFLCKYMYIYIDTYTFYIDMFKYICIDLYVFIHTYL